MWKFLVILGISFVIINSISKSQKYVARFGTVMNYDKFFIWLTNLYWKCLVTIPSKSYFLLRTLHLTCHHSKQHTVMLCSRYYIARVVTTMNYAKKNVIFITIHILIRRFFANFFFIRRLHRRHTSGFLFSRTGAPL